MATEHSRVHVCFGEPSIHRSELMQLAENRTVDYWTTNSQAKKSDRALFYMTAPLSAFVAWGDIQTDASLEARQRYNWSGHYMSKIGNVKILPRPVPLKELRNRLPEWGFLTLPRRSIAVPAGIVGQLEIILGETGKGEDNGIPDIDFMDISVTEGGRTRTLHFRRERDPKIIRAKRDRVLSETGKLKCEICGFDFAETYGQVGNGFCEVHHKIPLSGIETEVETKLEDLAILCSNCHRMIHRTNPMATITQLRNLLEGKQRRSLLPNNSVHPTAPKAGGG